MKVIIYTNKDGNVTVCYPSNEIPIEEVLQKDCPPGALIVDSASLPYQHNDFFDAWELKSGVVNINFSKAKEITKKRLRIERQPLLDIQDIAFQRALETGSDTTAIVAEKERLRNITSLADQATTLEQLKLIKC